MADLRERLARSRLALPGGDGWERGVPGALAERVAGGLASLRRVTVPGPAGQADPPAR